MRVLHLIGGGDIGGAKTHVLQLVKELGKFIDVKIISFREGPFAQDARIMGINIEVIKSGNVFKDIASVVRVIKNENYGIVHSHGAKANMISIISKYITGRPIVTTVHSDYRLDYMHSVIKSLTFGMINTISLRFMDYYIGVSNNFKNMLISRKFNPVNIFTVYNGVDFSNGTKVYSRKDFIEKYHIPLGDDDIIAGIAARLYPVKSISTLIDAAALVAEKNPAVKFIIGGDGEEREMLKAKVSDLNLEDHVFFTGWLNDPYELMGIVDISVLTSISESFAYSILEGARFKKATVSTRVGGIPDLIDSEEIGYLFEPGDYGALADYILELASNPKKREMLGENIYNRARDNFSLESMCRTQLDIYKKIFKYHGSGYLHDIVIAGYYGFKNIGDEALLTSIVKNMRTYIDDIRMMVLSNDPDGTKQTFLVNSINRFNLLKIIKAMKRSKMFMYGGGTLIQENTSTRSLIYYLGMIWVAKKAGLKVMLYANGIDPINKYINKRLTKNIINNVDMITLREPSSKSELEKLLIDRPQILVTADPAFTIESDCQGKADKIFALESIDGPGPYIGFSARKWDGHRNYTDIIARAADYAATSYGAIPVFIPMQYPADLQLIQNITAKMNHKAYIISNKYEVSEIMSIMKKFDMVVGMRLHALIFAMGAHVPVVSLEYQPKVAWLMEYTGTMKSSAGDVKNITLEKLKGVMDYTWNNRDEISLHLQNVVKDLKYSSFLNAKIAVELLKMEDRKNG